MFTINFKGKENPKTPQLVKLEAVFFKTGYPRVSKMIPITGLMKDWDNQTQQFKSKGVEAAEKNKALLEFKTKYLNVAQEWEAEGKFWAPVQWSHCFENNKKKRQSPKVVSVSQMFDILADKIGNRERLKNGKIITSAGTARHYAGLRKVLEVFTIQKYNRALSSFYFDEINVEFLEDFAFYIQKRGAENGNNGNIVGYLRILRGVVFYAGRMGVPDADIAIFLQIKEKMKPKKFEPKTIPLEVIRKIENIDRSLFSRLEQFHIDLFLFSFYTGGMANVDVCLLTWNCIDANDRLVYERTKYPKKASIVFHPKARIIAERYQEQCIDNYVLPVFKAKHNTEAKRYARMSNICAKVNSTLKKVAKIVHYDNKITWYSARGTFISTMIADNVPPAIVAEMAGNSAQTIYKHYFKNTSQQVIDAHVMARI